LIGPHRDDVAVRLGRADARAAASRGEQRLLALTLRLAEAAVVRRRLGHAPVLLLDDVLSELDSDAGGRVLTWLDGHGQALYSATDALPAARSAGTVWQVAPGRVDALVALTRGAA
jgi:DNA replication and repair protein RecF